MKREFVGNTILAISENLQLITQNGLAGDRDFVDPPLLAGYFKFRMYVHVEYLLKMLLWFGKSNYSCLVEADVLEEKMTKVFEKIPEDYFNKKSSTSIYTFNEFWKILLDDKDIPKVDQYKYKNTKVQTLLLWNAMHILFHPIIASSPLYYNIDADRYDEDRFPAVTCKNIYYEKALSMIINQHLNLPVDPKWKNSNLEATFEISFKETSSPNDTVVTKTTETKTLGEFWDDFSAAYWMNDETLLSTSSIYHRIQTDLAQSLAELQTVLTFHLFTISSDIDFAGVPWELGPLIEKERKDLEYFKKQTASLIKANESQSRTIETYRNNEWEEEKVYSTSKEEKLRELIGEAAKKLGIRIATRKNLKEFPGCRWIIRCTRRENGKITGIEEPLSIWRDVCLQVGLDFWNKSEIENGLYFFVDEEIIKGVIADPKLDSKIYNAFREDRMNNAQRKKTVSDIINQLDSSMSM